MRVENDTSKLVDKLAKMEGRTKMGEVKYLAEERHKQLVTKKNGGAS